MLIRSRAFTLVEIMVVVAIVAIIGAVASSAFRSFSAKSKWGEVTPCLSEAALRLENYRNNHGVYPVDDPWGAINSSGDCSDHYEGYINVFNDGVNYVIAFCDRKKNIWKAGKNDVWLVIDTNPAPIHYRNAVEDESDTVNDDYTAEIPSECSPSW